MSSSVRSSSSILLRKQSTQLCHTDDVILVLFGHRIVQAQHRISHRAAVKVQLAPYSAGFLWFVEVQTRLGGYVAEVVARRSVILLCPEECLSRISTVRSKRESRLGLRGYVRWGNLSSAFLLSPFLSILFQRLERVCVCVRAYIYTCARARARVHIYIV